jgi:hypothetical protein
VSKRCAQMLYICWRRTSCCLGSWRVWCTGGAEDYMSSKLVFDSPYVSVRKSKRAVVVYMNLAYIKIVQ